MPNPRDVLPVLGWCVAPRDLEAEIRALECQNELLRLALAKAHEELEGRNVRTFSTAFPLLRDVIPFNATLHA